MVEEEQHLEHAVFKEAVTRLTDNGRTENTKKDY